MVPGIPVWIRIDPELSQIDKVKSGLFFCLPDDRILNRLTIVDKSTRQGPAIGRILPPDQDNTITVADDGIDGWDRVTIPSRNRSPLLSTPA